MSAPRSAGGETSALRPRRLTNVNLAWAAGLGLAIAGLLYVLAWLTSGLLQAFPLHVYLLERGWIPYLVSYCFGLAVAVLALKQARLRREQKGFGIVAERVMPRDDAAREALGSDDAHQLLQRIRELPAADQDLMLVNRLKQAAYRIRTAQSSSEVDALVSTLADTDANLVESSYTVVRLLIALIPILGFLGTVYGIGLSIGTFAGVLEGAQSFQTVKPALGQAADGLGIAFDTTLLALLLSGVLLVMSAALQKREEDLLSAVDDYCISRLVARVHVPGELGNLERAVGRVGPEIRSALQLQTQALREALEERLPASPPSADEAPSDAPTRVSGAAPAPVGDGGPAPLDRAELDRWLTRLERELRRIRAVIGEAAADLRGELTGNLPGLTQAVQTGSERAEGLRQALEALHGVLAATPDRPPGTPAQEGSQASPPPQTGE